MVSDSSVMIWSRRRRAPARSGSPRSKARAGAVVLGQADEDQRQGAVVGLGDGGRAVARSRRRRGSRGCRAGAVRVGFEVAQQSREVLAPRRTPGSGRSPGRRACAIVSTPPAEDPRDRLEQEPDVPPHRPVGHVQVVELDHLLEGESLPPRTCQRPVIPGTRSSRRRAQPVIWSASCDHERARADQAHLAAGRAFQSCGSSSRLVRRKKAPMRVTRGSALILKSGPSTR